MQIDDCKDAIGEIVVTAEQIDKRLEELATEIDAHYPENSNLLLVGVLKGATYFMVDFSRKFRRDSEMDWMSLSSYGSGTKSSGVVRVLKDLSTGVKGRDVLIVEDIVDSGVTLAWLVNNLKSRGAKSVEVVALLRKPPLEGSDKGSDNRVKPRWVGFEIPNEFVVGYGLDYAEHYRALPCVAVLNPEVYS